MGLSETAPHDSTPGSEPYDGGTRGGGVQRPRPPREALTSRAPWDPIPTPGPAHRRDRSRGRGIRGTPARAALGLPDHHPGDRDDQGAGDSLRRDYVEPYPGTERRPQAPLPLRIHRISEPREGGRDPSGESAPARGPAPHTH